MNYDTYKVNFHFENIPDELMIYKNALIKLYVDVREKGCKIFNEKIEGINNAFAHTEKPWSFGEYMEDVNPEYVDFIRDSLATDFEVINSASPIVKLTIDEYGDLVGYIPQLIGSKIYATLSK